MASRLKADRHPLLRKSKMTEPIRKKKEKSRGLDEVGRVTCHCTVRLLN